MFVADSTPPAITCFSFDLGNEELSIDFSEAVVPGSLNVTYLALQSSAAAVVSGQTLRSLTGSTGIAFADNHESVRIGLTRGDITALKLSETFAEDASSLFLSSSSRLVSDYFDNLSVGIAESAARQVDNFTVDAVAPVLAGFDIDMDLGVLTLSFSEVIRADTFTANKFTIQGDGSAASQRYVLTGGDILVDPTDLCSWSPSSR